VQDFRLDFKFAMMMISDMTQIAATSFAYFYFGTDIPAAE